MIFRCNKRGDILYSNGYFRTFDVLPHRRRGSAISRNDLFFETAGEVQGEAGGRCFKNYQHRNDHKTDDDNRNTDSPDDREEHIYKGTPDFADLVIGNDVLEDQCRNQQ